jgi:hypothetical protein
MRIVFEICHIARLHLRETKITHAYFVVVVDLQYNGGVVVVVVVVKR